MPPNRTVSEREPGSRSTDGPRGRGIAPRRLDGAQAGGENRRADRGSSAERPDGAGVPFVARPDRLDPDGVRRLQRLAGNSAVVGLVTGDRRATGRTTTPSARRPVAPVARDTASTPSHQPTVQRDGPSATTTDPGATPAPVSHDAEGFQAPSPELMHQVSERIMTDVLSVAVNGFPGADISIRNSDTSLDASTSMVGASGTAPGYLDPRIVDDLKIMLKWSFERPGEYLLQLRRNAKRELMVSSWQPLRYLIKRPAPGVAMTGEGRNNVVLVGSPKPGQAYPMEFVSAGQQVAGHTVWIVERTGYELAHVDLQDVIKKAPGGQVTWVTSAGEVTAAINALPKGSVQVMKVFSHGVRGQVDLRYGWDGKADYGIDKAGARAIDGSVFSPSGVIDLESCNGGTNIDGDSLAQTIADATGRNTFGWTGRTSYGDVNAGTGGVRGSSLGLNWDMFAELWSRWKAESPPTDKMFTPKVQRDLGDDAALAETKKLPAAVQSGNGGGAPLADDDQRHEFLRAGKEWFGSYQDTIDHFAAIAPTGVPGHPLMSAQARPRLEAAVNEVGGKVPASTTAFSFRNTFTKATHLSPLSMHTLGHAIDYDATLLPRIGRDETAELIKDVTGSPSNLELGEYSARRTTIEKMGNVTEQQEAAAAATAAATTTGTATTPTTSQTAGTPPTPTAPPTQSTAANALLATVTSESQRLERTSEQFQGSLGASRQAFLDLRTKYFEAKPADRPDLLTKVPALVTPWTAAIDTAEKGITGQVTAAGFTAATLPDAQHVRAQLWSLQAASAAAHRAAASRSDKPPSAAEIRKLEGWRKVLAPIAVPTTDTDPYRDSARTIADAVDARIAALSPLVDARQRLATIARLRALLADPVFLFGRQAGGKATTKLEVSGPSMAQLLEHGNFSVGSTAPGATQVAPAFLVALAKHGFDLGAAWSGEYTDSMHMELIVHKPAG